MKFVANRGIFHNFPCFLPDHGFRILPEIRDFRPKKGIKNPYDYQNHTDFRWLLR